MRISGAVLAGGRSTRMGATKATVQVDGVAMAERVANALAGGGCDPVLVIGEPTELVDLRLDVVADDPPTGIGPVGGVLTALRTFEGADAVFVAACDLAYLPPTVVSAMIAEFRPEHVDAVVARTHRLEPGCVIWAVGARPQIAELVASGERALHAVLARLRTVEVRVSSAALRNINSPCDLERDTES